jgi:hypothetical protein
VRVADVFSSRLRRVFSFLSYGRVLPQARYLQRTMFTVYMQSFLEFSSLIKHYGGLIWSSLRQTLLLFSRKKFMLLLWLKEELDFDYFGKMEFE